MKKNSKIIANLVINVIVFIFGSIAIGVQMFGSVTKDNGVSTNGLDIFRFFTNDGNIFCIIVSFITIIIVILSIFKKVAISRWLFILQLASAVTGTIIFLVVVLLLTPKMGLGLLNGYTMIVLHVINPLLLIINFLMFSINEGECKKKYCLFGAFPVLIYGIISLCLVLCKVWEGSLIPYPFLEIYKNPWWASILYFMGIVGGAFGLSFLLLLLEGKNSKLFSR